MAGKVDFDTLRQETLASPLAAAVQGCAARLGFHARAEPKLLLARAFGRLVSAFHRIRSVEPRKLTVSTRESISFLEFVTRPSSATLQQIPDSAWRRGCLIFQPTSCGCILYFYKAMPTYCYKIDLDARVIEERYTGLVGIDFINQCLKQLSADAGFDPSFDIVVDFGEARFDDSCRDQLMLKEAVECHDETYKAGRSKTAVIVGSPYNTACALLFKNRSATRNIEIFSTRKAAWDWIGHLPPPGD